MHSGEFGGDLAVRPDLLGGSRLGANASSSQRDNLSAHNGPFDEGSAVLNGIRQTGAVEMIRIVDEYLGHKIQVRSSYDAGEIGRTSVARKVDRSPTQSDDGVRYFRARPSQIGGSAKFSTRAELCRKKVARPSVAARLVGARRRRKSVGGCAQHISIAGAVRVHCRTAGDIRGINQCRAGRIQLRQNSTNILVIGSYPGGGWPSRLERPGGNREIARKGCAEYDGIPLGVHPDR